MAEKILPLLRENAAQVDGDATFPEAGLRALRECGLMGLLVPEEHGGLGGDLHDLVDVAGVLASACLSTAMIWAMYCQQVDAVVRFAVPGLAKDLLPRIAAGEVYLASVTTEAGSGGHLMTADASLRSGGEGIAFERLAPIVTGGRYADGFLITMRDGEDTTANKVTLVYAARDQLELETSGEWNPLGMRGTHSEGMRITGTIRPDGVIGPRGGYRTVAVESAIPLAHLAWSACWLGAARSATADVIGLLRSRKRPGSIDLSSDLVSERLARVRMDLELVSAYLRTVCDEITECRTDGRTVDVPSTQIHLNTLKVAAAEHTFRAVDRLVQLCGLSTGYLRTSPIPLERHFRDLRSASLNYANDRLLKANGSLSLVDRGVRLA
ncbi:acyl-CoA dehydrogenase [Lentzea pudingi]|uniref:Acyl-CoA dehydrogenase n=1 Tax=Lentzea pudingi TaxID=1789439 RepID=A0ABQ2HRD4_9PSEU|nr:acyl-CoA dehydrogenase family protein [Lentzea pudingi]GGM89387.1 acyl-CoA dehydrogenase [Lentzea pudingi]